MSSLKKLKTVEKAEVAEATAPVETPEVQAPAPEAENKLKKLKSLKEVKPATETPAKEAKVKKEGSNRAFKDAEYAKYLMILNDGQPHAISDLLKEFGLPSTSSGREKLRAANRKIASVAIDGKKYKVEGVFPEGKGKHFQLMAE